MAQPTLSIRTLLAAPARAVIRAGLACLARWIDLPAHPHESAGERAVVISDGCHLPAQRPDLRSTGDTTGILSNHSTRSSSSDSGRQQERWISQEDPRPPASRCKTCHVEGAARRRPKRPWRTTVNLQLHFLHQWRDCKLVRTGHACARDHALRLRSGIARRATPRRQARAPASVLVGPQVRPAITHSQSFAE